jgi:hypothetical protein
MRRSLRIDTLYSYESSDAPTSRISAFVNNVDPMEADIEIQRFLSVHERADASGPDMVSCVTLEAKIDLPFNLKNMSANPEMAAVLIRREVKTYPFTLRSWYVLHNERSSSLRFDIGKI